MSKTIIGEVCPPVKSREWKELVKKVGTEDKARAYWLATMRINPDGEPSIPTAQQLKELGYVEEHVPRAAALVATLQQQVNLLYKKKGKTQDKVVRSNIDIKIEKLKNDIEYLSEQADDLGERKLVVLGELGGYAEKHLEEVTNTLNKEVVTFDDLESTRRLIALWKKAGDFSKDHLFMSEDDIEEALRRDENGELVNPDYNEIYNKFKMWQARAEHLSFKWNKVALDLLQEEGKKAFNNPYFEIKQILKDIGWGTSLFMHMGESDNAMFELMQEMHKKANYEALNEAKVIEKNVDELIDKVSKKFTLSKVFNLFRQTQSNTDSRETGDVTFRFSQLFFNEREKIKLKKESDIEYAKTIADPNKMWEAIKTANKKYSDSVKENEVIFDVRKLFVDYTMYNYEEEYTDEDIQKHKQEMISHLGQKGYEYFLERVKNKIEEYKLEEKAKEKSFNDSYSEDPGLAQAEFEAWKLTHNPYMVAEYLNDGIKNEIQGKFITPSTKYIESVPRRIANGKDTGFYDKKFEQIEADEDLLNLYKYFIDTLNELNKFLPEDERQHLHVNTLPTIHRTFIESLIAGGVRNVGNEFLDLLNENIRTDNLTTTVLPESRDLAGTPETKIQLQYIQDTRGKLKEHVEFKTLEYVSETGTKPTHEIIEEWKKNYLNELAQEKSFDIGKVLKAYSLMVLGYKHKAVVEDVVKAADQIIQNSVENITNPAGDTMNYTSGKAVTEKGLAGQMTMWKDFLNHFYGYKTQKVEFQTNVKKYTKTERTKKEALERLIAKNLEKFKNKEIKQADFIKNDEILKDQLKHLGGKVTGSKILDVIMKWVQLKGLGWNYLSAMVNLGVGFPSNLIEAAAGEKFNEEELMKGYGMVLHSMGKFLSFGAIDTKTAQKIFNMADKMDLLKESRYEITNKTTKGSKFGKFSKNFKYVMPFTAQSSTEYINQAPVMIAMMLHTKFINELDGKEYNLWEVYDETSKLKEGIKLPDNLEFRMKSKIDDALVLIHGNYDPDKSMPGKQYSLFRMVGQFRVGWATSGFYSRFGAEKYSNIAGLTKKGRYRSYGAIYKELGALQSLAFTTKALVRKLTFGTIFKGTDFNKLVDQEGYFTETDAANMRKNLTEMVVLMAVNALGLLLKAGLDDDEDKKKGMYNLLAFSLINQMSRVETDMLFYTNPMAFEQLQRNTMPIFTVVTDWYEIMKRSTILLAGGDDTYDVGVNKGRSKTLVAIEKGFPGTVIPGRIKSITTQDYNKDSILNQIMKDNE